MPDIKPSRLSIAPSRDRDGRTVIAVVLSNCPGDHAMVYVEDFCRIVSEHGCGPWFVNKRTTRAPAVLLESRADRRQHLVARLVAREPKGRIVEPVDGNLCNLRRSNLLCRPGGRGGQRTSPAKAPAESTDRAFMAEAATVA